MDDPVDEVEVGGRAALAQVGLEGGEVAVVAVRHRDERACRDELEDDAREDRQRPVGAVDHVEQLVRPAPATRRSPVPVTTSYSRQVSWKPP